MTGEGRAAVNARQFRGESASRSSLKRRPATDLHSDLGQGPCGGEIQIINGLQLYVNRKQSTQRSQCTNGRRGFELSMKTWTNLARLGNQSIIPAVRFSPGVEGHACVCPCGVSLLVGKTLNRSLGEISKQIGVIRPGILPGYWI
jgi:hypothetical protein